MTLSLFINIITKHGRRLRRDWGTVPPKFKVGEGPCLCPPNIWETRYRKKQIFGKHVIETYKLYILISLRVVCHCVKKRSFGNLARNISGYGSEMIFGSSRPSLRLCHQAMIFE